MYPGFTNVSCKSDDVDEMVDILLYQILEMASSMNVTQFEHIKSVLEKLARCELIWFLWNQSETLGCADYSLWPEVYNANVCVSVPSERENKEENSALAVYKRLFLGCDLSAVARRLFSNASVLFARPSP